MEEEGPHQAASAVTSAVTPAEHAVQAGEPSSAPKEVMYHNQKERIRDPDLMPQAIYPRLEPKAWAAAIPNTERKPLPALPVEPTGPADRAIVQRAGDASPHLDQRSSQTTSRDFSEANTPQPAKFEIEEPRPGAASRKRRCGMAPRTFWIVLGVTIVLILAIIGGAVGGTLAHRADDDYDSGGSYSSPYGDLYYDSRIGATNWTDANGTSHHAVFYQSSGLAIMMSLWNGSTQTWTAQNVSASLAQAGVEINATYSTPLAVVSSGPPLYDFEMHLYYLTGNFTVNEIWTTDPTGAVWQAGDLNNYNKTTLQTSDLAAVWHRCGPACPNAIYVAYQAIDQYLCILNSTDWGDNETDTELWQMDPSTGMAMTLFRSPVPQTTNSNSSGSGSAQSNADANGPLDVRMFADSNAALNELTYNATGDWDDGDQLALGIPVIDPHPQFAATWLDHYNELQVVSLNPNGSLSTWYTTDGKWTSTIPVRYENFTNYEYIFSSIAMNSDGQFYGLVNNLNIEIFTPNATNPALFSHVGTVDIVPQTRPDP